MAMGLDLTVSMPDGGMQVAAQLGARYDDIDLCCRLAQAGLTARPLSRHYFTEARASGLFLGFAAWNESEIDAGVAILARVMRETDAPK